MLFELFDMCISILAENIGRQPLSQLYPNEMVVATLEEKMTATVVHLLQE